jgi:hypothetical protein
MLDRDPRGLHGVPLVHVHTISQGVHCDSISNLCPYLHHKITSISCSTPVSSLINKLYPQAHNQSIHRHFLWPVDGRQKLLDLRVRPIQHLK